MNKFNDYVTKVLNDDETVILKQIFIDCGYDEYEILQLNNFQMLYMPNIEITKENIQKIMENEKYIYYLIDRNYITPYLKSKLSLSTLYHKRFSIIGMKISIHSKFYTFPIWFYDSKIMYNKNHTIFCNSIYDPIKYRLLCTFMMLNYIIIPDIARYLFLMYYDVVFG